MNDAARQVDAALLGTDQAKQLSTARARQLDAFMNPRGGFAVGTYRHPMAPVPLRPQLLSQDTAVLMEAASRRLLRLVRDVCAARAPGMAALADALGYQMPPASLFTDNPSWTRWSLSMARPDLVLSGGRLRFTECNVNSAIGGPEHLMELDSFYWEEPTFRPLARSLGLWSLDSFEARRRVVAAAGRSRGSTRPTVCLLGYSKDDAREEDRFRRAVDDFSRHGLPCVYATSGELDHGPRGLRYQDFEIDVVVRLFTIADAHEDEVDVSALKQAVANDTTLILAPEAGSLYGNKKTFAWLTQDADMMRADDQRFLAEMVPWTWELADTSARWEGQLVDLLDLVEREREILVLKPTGSYFGQGIVAGRDQDAAQWRGAIEAALSDGNHVVQRFYPPDLVEQPVYLPAENEADMRPMASVYGPLLIGGTLSGVFARQVADPACSVITTRNGGVANTAFFYR